MKMEDMMAVTNGQGGILGKLLYYSLSNVLIDRTTFEEVGQRLGLAKTKPARASVTDAFRNATSDIHSRITSSYGGSLAIKKVYCRDNQSSVPGRIGRELVKETLGDSTNSYEKLANLYYDKEKDTVIYENVSTDSDVDVYALCNRAVELFELYKTCYGSSHVDSVLSALLDQMQASKISVYGKLYFVPRQNLSLVDLMEDYIAELNLHNRNGGARNQDGDTKINVNSMFVVDDAKQREKMADEFYANYRRDIESYQERIQKFLANGVRSSAVVDRWMLKIRALQAKKAAYEEVLRQNLNSLDDDFAILQMQAAELRIRTQTGQASNLKSA